MSPPTEHRAVRWYPPSYDVRVETVPTPKIQHSDDAIIKVTLAGLCGSDLHIYRGHGGVNEPIVCGHEFIGHVAALGDGFGQKSNDRPELYNTLKIGNKVVSPFTTNCGECHSCRLGFTCRCPKGLLFGCPALEGGQAQYVRVPNAGGTLFSLDDADTWPKNVAPEDRQIADSSLLLLADILPTGVFAALQALQHPKIAPMITGQKWPDAFAATPSVARLSFEDTSLTFSVIGLGPVGLCASIALLDELAKRGLDFNIVAIDLSESRRDKMKSIYAAMDPAGRGKGKFSIESPEGAKKLISEWTSDIGCSAVLEVVGNNPAMELAYALVRPFGVITSVGVHGKVPFTLTGGMMYDKNISLDFGRCPARAMFPPAFELLVRRQDVFGGVGESASLVDKIVGMEEAAESYASFDKGLCGKVLFDPWK